MSEKRTVLVSKLLPQPMEKTLNSHGFEVIRLMPSTAIKSEVRYHPDILCCKTPEGIWFGDPVVCELMSGLVDFRAGSSVSDGYPNEVLYNCFFNNRYLFASRYTDSSVLQYAADNGYQIVFVKQGYTKCSVAICGKDSFITADRGIYSELEKSGYNVLLIDGSDIMLNGYNCGFIGGCTGLLGNVLAFTGSLEHMRDGDKIKRFLEHIGVGVLELSNDALYDYGGLLLI